MIISVTIIIVAVIFAYTWLAISAMKLQKSAMEGAFNYATRYNQQLAEQSEAERKHEAKMVGGLGKPPDIVDTQELEDRAEGFIPENIPVSTDGVGAIV